MKTHPFSFEIHESLCITPRFLLMTFQTRIHPVLNKRKRILSLILLLSKTEKAPFNEAYHTNFMVSIHYGKKNNMLHSSMVWSFKLACTKLGWDFFVFPSSQQSTEGGSARSPTSILIAWLWLTFFPYAQKKPSIHFSYVRFFIKWMWFYGWH